jgi:hypothetical protein
MAAEDIRRDFPALDRSSYEPPYSGEDFNYNCLAFVLGDRNNWWEPPGLFGHYWPPGFPEDVTVETVTDIIRLHGFVVEPYDITHLETDSIAIYANGSEWTHFAKFSNGIWMSKLGEGNDIKHLRLEDLEGEKYGKVVKILSRKSQRHT